MAVITFAAIDIASYHVIMEIFQISKKQGLKSLDYLEKRIELGKDTFVEGRISNGMVDELCLILKDLKRIMKEYQVVDYRACASSAIREAENSQIVLGRIYQNTGIKVDVLSNSEQRFLGYKSVASTEAEFPNIITKGTAVLDMGGGSVQVSLFDKDMLITTQNLMLGNFRVRERLSALENSVLHYETLVEEFIRNEIISFKKVHLKDRKIQNLVLVGGFLSDIFTKTSESKKMFTKEEFLELYQRVINSSPIELAMHLNIPLENAALLIPTVIIYQYFMKEFGAEIIWAPGTQLTDGIAYDYAEKIKMIKSAHNFDNDIVMAARTMGKRYGVSKAHVQSVMNIALTIYDSTKKIHGLTPRERLLLECAVNLHDCGKFVSLTNTAECNYQIIMATEIIGLSHREREIIAQVVRLNTIPMESYETISKKADLNVNDYLIINKLTAILRLANGMDRSHLQKVQQIRAVIKDDNLVINVTTNKDYTLEQGLLTGKIEFFETVFGIKTVLKVKKSDEKSIKASNTSTRG